MRRVVLCEMTDIMLAYIALYDHYIDVDVVDVDLESITSYFTSESDSMDEGFVVEDELYENFLESLDFLDAFAMAVESEGKICKVTAHNLYLTYLKCLANDYTFIGVESVIANKEHILTAVLNPNNYGKLEYAEEEIGEDEDEGYSKTIQEIVDEFNHKYGR